MKKPRCGATPEGAPCRVLTGSTRSQRYTRCRNHGGLSTGPRTAEGTGTIRTDDDPALVTSTSRICINLVPAGLLRQPGDVLCAVGAFAEFLCSFAETHLGSGALPAIARLCGGRVSGDHGCRNSDQFAPLDCPALDQETVRGRAAAVLGDPQFAAAAYRGVKTPRADCRARTRAESRLKPSPCSLRQNT